MIEDGITILDCLLHKAAHHLTSIMDSSDEEFNPLRGASPINHDDNFDDEPVESTREKNRAAAGNMKSGEISTLRGANGYSWEDEYQRTWDIGTDGNDQQSLEHIIRTMMESRKKKILKDLTPFQRGIIRTMIVVLDGSLAMLEKDLRPTRMTLTLQYLTDFITEFFDQNPISQMGILMMRNGVANLISEVSGSPQYHLERLRQLKLRQHNRYEPKGDPSLQNALEMARSMLKYRGQELKHLKEVLVIFGSLFTLDPGNIHKTIDSLVKDDIKCKVIGLLAQVAICQELVTKTNGGSVTTAIDKNYGVIMNEAHYKDLMMDCVNPLPISEEEKQKQSLQTGKDTQGVPLLRMGFPLKSQPNLGHSLNNSQFTIDYPVLLASHPTNGSDASNQMVLVTNTITAESTSIAEAGQLAVIGYQCPQCKNRVTNLPTICPVCGLMLILSTHLARLYHHLLPLAPYDEVPVASSYSSDTCEGCMLIFPTPQEVSLTELKSLLRYQCKKCNHVYCIDCDVFIHETLHNCPGCENNTSV